MRRGFDVCDHLSRRTINPLLLHLSSLWCSGGILALALYGLRGNPVIECMLSRCLWSLSIVFTIPGSNDEVHRICTNSTKTLTKRLLA